MSGSKRNRADTSDGGGQPAAGLIARRSRYVTQAGLIAALYAAATIPFIQNPLTYGPVQLRLSEALTVLALFTPAAIPGLAIGCAVANGAMVAQFGASALLDVFFGSLATFLGAVWTFRHRRRPGIALLGPVVANALIVAAYLPIVLAATGMYDQVVFGIRVDESWVWMFLFGAVTIAAGEAAVVYLVGGPLALALRLSGAARIVGGDEDPALGHGRGGHG
ncbi:MAG: QueT transporter family protein [Coriobacteriia bacterium]|nr:QueT transporter family protein [Coriobacteriia bacterium]